VVAGVTLPHVDRALLVAEWPEGRCPFCRRLQSTGRHEPECSHDLALAERGFPTQVERDSARYNLVAPTLPAL